MTSSPPFTWMVERSSIITAVNKCLSGSRYDDLSNLFSTAEKRTGHKIVRRQILFVNLTAPHFCSFYLCGAVRKRIWMLAGTISREHVVEALATCSRTLHLSHIYLADVRCKRWREDWFLTSSRQMALTAGESIYDLTVHKKPPDCEINSYIHSRWTIGRNSPWMKGCKFMVNWPVHHMIHHISSS